MPITKTTHYSYSNGMATHDPKTTVHYAGRVVAVETITETRNWSDTMDYSDFRTTTCTYALVWMGTRGVPAEYRGGRDLVWYFENDVPEYRKDDVRDLLPHEQFGWVDCTNLFSDRNGFSLDCAVDGLDMQLLWGGVEMLDAYAAYKAHLVARKELEAREAERVAEEARKGAAARKAKADKKAAKEAAAKSESEKLLAKVPAKGTKVTVGGFSGKVFWVGVTKYRSKWQARFGVKDSKGNVQWFDHTQVGK